MLGTVSEEGWPFVFQASSTPISESLYILAVAYLFNVDVVSVPTRHYVADHHALDEARSSSYFGAVPLMDGFTSGHPSVPSTKHLGRLGLPSPHC